MGRKLEINDFLSYQLYPKVFDQAYEHHLKYGNVMNIPTKNFFYGMEIGEEIMVPIEQGKNVLIQLQLVGEPDDNGMVSLFFKVNGQLSHVQVKDQSIVVNEVKNEVADPENPEHIASPLQGLLSNVMVSKGQEVKRNQPLFVIEAMKMETTVTAIEDGVVDRVVLNKGSLVSGEDLVLVVKPV